MSFHGLGQGITAVLILATGGLAMTVAVFSSHMTRRLAVNEKELLQSLVIDLDNRAKTRTDTIQKILTVVGPRDHDVSGNQAFTLDDVIRLVRQVDLSAEESHGDTEWTVVEKLFQGYHAQALFQSSLQFWFSVVAASVGFLLIVYMAITASSVEGKLTESATGGFIDAISVLFFRQAAETRVRATEFFDRLRKDNETVRALSVIESIDDKNLRSGVKALVALHISGSDVDRLDINTYLAWLTHGHRADPSDD